MFLPFISTENFYKDNLMSCHMTDWCFAISRSGFGECKVFSTEREINSEGVTIAGNNMVQMHIISITRGMTGIGRKTLHSEVTVVILGRLLGPPQALHYHITTLSLDLTGIARYKMSSDLLKTRNLVQFACLIFFPLFMNCSELSVVPTVNRKWDDRNMVEFFSLSISI